MTPRRPPISTRHWMVVVGSGLLMALNVLSFVAAGLLLPPLAASLEVGLGEAMLFVSISMIAGAATLMTAGPYLFRVLGARKLSVVGGVLSGAAVFAVSYVHSLAPLYVLAFFAGLLATVALQMTGAALVNEWFLERRGLMQGMLMGIASLGGVLAGTALPLALDTGGWRLGFQVVGTVTAAVAVFAGLVLIRNHPADVGLHAYGVEHHEPHEQTSLPGAGRLELAGVAPSRALRTLPFAALVLALVAYSGMMALQQNFAAMMEDRGLDVTAVGTLFSVLSIANIGTTLVLGAVSDRWGPVTAYILAGCLLVVALGMFLLTSGFASQLVAVLVFSLPAIAPPIMTPILLRAAFGARAFLPLLGLVTATMPIGIAIGSPLWGWARDTTGSYSSALGVAIGLTGLCVALVVFAVLAGRGMWTSSPTAEPDEVLHSPSS